MHLSEGSLQRAPVLSNSRDLLVQMRRSIENGPGAVV
jgi:hypothetical protein